MAEPLIAIVGPTASGKSALAMALARRLRGEIVNADAAQLYRGMDIGTAKPTEAERAEIPHHQLDVITVREEASVAAYQREARADIARIEGRGARPIVVGGSGLYVRALLDELTFPGTDRAVRARIAAHVEEVGAEVAHRELAALDPSAALAIESGNARRITRALEVIELTGQPFVASLPEPRYHRPTVQLGLRADMAWLDRRIEERTGAMLDAGLVAEVSGLVADGLLEGRGAQRAVGYRQVLDQLAGTLAPDATAGAIALATRRLARRQIKWFRRDGRIVWLQADQPPERLEAEAIAAIANCSQ